MLGASRWGEGHGLSALLDGGARDAWCGTAFESPELIFRRDSGRDADFLGDHARFVPNGRPWRRVIGIAAPDPFETFGMRRGPLVGCPDGPRQTVPYGTNCFVIDQIRNRA